MKSLRYFANILHTSYEVILNFIPTFIPTTSALDAQWVNRILTYNTKWKDIWWNSVTGRHVPKTGLPRRPPGCWWARSTNTHSGASWRPPAGTRSWAWASGAHAVPPSSAWATGVDDDADELIDESGSPCDPSADREDSIDDGLPSSATTVGSPVWATSNPVPQWGFAAHKEAFATGTHQHFFYGDQNGLTVGAGSMVYADIRLDGQYKPLQLMLQWNDGSWEHRAYRGESIIGWGTEGTASRLYMGLLPDAGKWVRLQVPARDLGLEGKTLNGMAFTLYDGEATFDGAGRSVLSEEVWIEDSVPSYVTLYGTWDWVTSPGPYSGSKAHKEGAASGNPPALLHRRGRRLAPQLLHQGGLLGGHAGHLRVPRPGQPAERGQAAVERRRDLGAPRILGLELHRLGHERDQ